MAKRVLEIAARDSHTILLGVPPGTGKSMLANRLPGILSPMTIDDALAVVAVIFVSQQRINADRFRCRVFRASHATASGVALVGGSSNPRFG